MLRKKRKKRSSPPGLSSFTSTNRLRFYALGIPIAVVWVVLVLRSAQLQILENRHYKQLASSQIWRKEIRHAARGEILDRRLNPLATNRATFSVGVDPGAVTRPRETAQRIASVLNRRPEEVLRQILKAKSFHWLGRKLDTEPIERLRDLNLQGLVFVKEYQRTYPYGSTAAHVVGFTNIDNEGLAGTELTFDSQLRGRDGHVFLLRDAHNNEFVDPNRPAVPPEDGKHLVLTLDYVYQTIAEEELQRTVQKYNAKGGCVVVIRPSTGEVLAMVSSPGFDPNRFTDYPEAFFRNRVVSDIFEPGSTFKIVPFSALLEAGIKNPDDIVFAENGVYRLASRTIRDNEEYGWLTVADVLKNSSNIGTVKLGMELGQKRLFRTARAFGFGSITGIELPGESGGMLSEPSRWSPFTPASMSIGYEVGVTALQLAMAYGAIANGGILLQPQIAVGTFDQLPREIPELKPVAIRRVISQKTASRMRGLLERVVSDGTGKLAAIEGLRIAGKTGTAKKPRSDGSGYSDRDYVASFVGFYPVDRPEILIAVMVDQPHPVHWGGSVAAPTFRHILERILRVRAETTPNRERPQQTGPVRQPTIKVPNVTDRSVSAATAMLRGMGLRVQTEGQGKFVLTQIPAPGERIEPDSRILLSLYSPPLEQRVQMPDLVGRTLREAVVALSARGLRAAVYGQGVVVNQQPQPGEWLAAGKRAALYGRSESAPVIALLEE